MAILNAGAMQSRGRNSYIMAADAVAFCTLLWHGAHRETGGLGKDPDISVGLDIADKVASGQFELYFCSTSCLRDFLNYCVDELERRIGSAKKRARRRPKRA